MTEVKVTQMGDTNVNIPSEWNVSKGNWQYFDVKNCWENGKFFNGNFHTIVTLSTFVIKFPH